jgi:hypothetical protein
VPYEFARWAEGVRAQREIAAAVLASLDSKSIEQRIGENERSALKKTLTEQVANYDGWLDKATTALFKKDAADREARRQEELHPRPSMSARGAPTPPNAPRLYSSPAYQMATDGLFPGSYESIGYGASALNFPLRPGMGASSATLATKIAPRLASAVGIVDILNFGYSAGGWMGNEVEIKGHMADNYKLKQDYEKQVERYNREVDEWNDPNSSWRRTWEENRARERDERKAAADVQRRIFFALFGRTSTYNPPRPPPPPKVELPKVQPQVRNDDDFRRVPLAISCMNSTIRCHQPNNDSKGFKLSLTGFDAIGNQTSRRSNTNIDPEMIRQLLLQPSGSSDARVGTKR